MNVLCLKLKMYCIRIRIENLAGCLPASSSYPIFLAIIIAVLLRSRSRLCWWWGPLLLLLLFVNVAFVLCLWHITVCVRSFYFFYIVVATSFSMDFYNLKKKKTNKNPKKTSCVALYLAFTLDVIWFLCSTFLWGN